MDSRKIIYGEISAPQEVVGHIGGRPIISQCSTPLNCRVCGKEMTFFFLMGFPNWHNWRDKTVSVYACTVRDHPGHEIPRIYTDPSADSVRGINLPPGYLNEYQTNFAIKVSDILDSDQVRYEKGKIVQRSALQKKVKRLKITDCGFAPAPTWHGDDESPGEYEGEKLEFLFQVKGNAQFDIEDDAPYQARKVIHPSLPAYRNERNYILFLGNRLYFFGNSVSKDSVYIVSQRP